MVGPFPPPTHGMSLVTQRLADLFSRRHEVARVDVAAPGLERTFGYHARRLVRNLASIAKTIRERLRGAKKVYIACNGGKLGQVYHCLHLLVCRLLGLEVYLHLHSYAYINTPYATMSWILRLGGSRLFPIFLSRTMRTDFARSYRCGVSFVVDNSVCIEPQARVLERPERVLTLGLLGNLDEQKGLLEFLAVMDTARKRGLPVHGILAGPASDEYRALIDQHVERMGHALRYLGPVHGEAKADFFRAIDVFVFATRYRNEAQPLVVFEAHSQGVPVIVRDRGCISDQLGPGDLLVPNDVDFVEQTLMQLESRLERGGLEQLRRRVTAHYTERYANSLQGAEALEQSLFPVERQETDCP